jgi:hypothetical protein
MIQVGHMSSQGSLKVEKTGNQSDAMWTRSTIAGSEYSGRGYKLRNAGSPEKLEKAKKLISP